MNWLTTKEIAKHRVFIAYCLTGAAVTWLELILLYCLVDILLWNYLLASSLVFAIGLILSFFARKFLVFKNNDWLLVFRQFLLYSFILLINLGLNFALMYFLVDIIHLALLLAQFVSGMFLGVISFIFNTFFTFKPVSDVSLNLPQKIDLIKEELKH